MRDVLLSMLIPAALIWGLFSAPASVLVLNWIWFQRPYDFSWGLWSTMPVFMIALIICAASNFVRGQLRVRFPPILVVYLLLLIWVGISATFAFNPRRAWHFYLVYAPSMLVSPILMFAVIRDLPLLRAVLWVAAGGIGLNGFKTGVMLTASGGGHLTDQISGFVGDNNVFGLVLCLVFGILLGLRSTLPRRKTIRWAFYVFLAFILLCIIFTKSRGAIITVGVIALAASVLSGRPIRGVVLTLAVASLFYWMVPAQYFDRLSGLEDVSDDRSAMGRTENWQLAWNAALKFPVLGVGPDNHIPYNSSIQSAVQVRVAHSVYFQILGELGFPALILYLTFVAIAIRSLFRSWRLMVPLVTEFPDLLWVRDVSFWMLCALIGYVVGSALLNMFYIEFPWYAAFYGSMLGPSVVACIEQRRRAPPVKSMTEGSA